MAINQLTLFIFGAVIGSFINVLSLRYQEDKPVFSRSSIGGRSHCPQCQKQLAWYELIPLVSFIIQRGRCRSCKTRLNWQYPIVEIISGLAMALTPSAIFNSYQVSLFMRDGTAPIWYYYLAAIFTIGVLILILISAIDFRLRIIPDQSNLLLGALGIAAIVVKSVYGLFGDLKGSFLGHYAAIFGSRNNIWVNHATAALFGLLFFGLIIFLSRGRAMGMGDLKLAIAIGLLIGWPDAILALMLAFITGSIWSIILMVRGAKNLRSTVPFGPFMALGVVLVILCGARIMDGYFSLFPIN